MNVLLFGTVAEGQGYPRVRGLVAGLESLGAKIERLTRPLDRFSQGRARGSRFGAAVRIVRLFGARRALLQAGRSLARPDLVLVGYPAQTTADLPGRLWPGVPVLVDFFLSVFDTAVTDRGLFRAGSLAGRALSWIDRRAAAAGSAVLVDTPQMGAYAAHLTGLPAARFHVLPCGDPDAPLSPAPYRPPVAGEPLRVLLVGTGVPLHGLEHVLDAVHRFPALELTLVGGGMQAQELLAARPCARVRHVREWVDRARLSDFYRECHLALGVFGSSPKAGRVVPLKVYHALAEGRPVLTGHSQAVASLLAPGRELLTCARGSGPALAAALEKAHAAPELLSALAREGRLAFQERFSTQALGRRLQEVLADLAGRGR